MMTTETFLRTQEWVGDYRVLVGRVSRQWSILGSWVAMSPPEQQGQLVQEIGFVGEITAEGRRLLSLL